MTRACNQHFPTRNVQDRASRPSALRLITPVFCDAAENRGSIPPIPASGYGHLAVRTPRATAPPPKARDRVQPEIFLLPTLSPAATWWQRQRHRRMANSLNDGGTTSRQCTRGLSGPLASSAGSSTMRPRLTTTSCSPLAHTLGSQWGRSVDKSAPPTPAR